jgi:hypothetical protein
MIWHPWTWAFWTAAVSGGFLYGAAAVLAMDVATGWRPDLSDPSQLRREGRAERQNLLCLGAMACLLVAAILMVAGISLFWHRLIPGAMCGTGVLQAMGENGRRALIFWAMAWIIFYLWHVVVRLDQTRPENLLAQTHARMLLAVSPFLVLAMHASASALFRIDASPPVNCCAALYDQVLNSSPAGSQAYRLALVCLWISIFGTVALPGAIYWISQRSHHPVANDMSAILSIGWAIASMVAVKYFWSSYYYQVLSHPCPWCIFLPEHRGIGFLIFGCIFIVMLESLAFWAAGRVYHVYPLIGDTVRVRCRKAFWRIMAAIMLYTGLTLGPAAVWRLWAGVWINGFL